MQRGWPAAWIVVLIPACFHPEFDHVKCGPDRECPSDLRCNCQGYCVIDTPDHREPCTPDATTPEATTQFGSIYKIQLSSLPGSAITVVDNDLDIDTDTSSLCDAEVTMYCVVAGTSFVIGAGKALQGHGNRPLVLVSMTSFEADGDIDVSSNRARRGAGAVGASSCLGATPAAPSGQAGGFGGSFGGMGGNGEVANGPEGKSALPFSGFPTVLRGGCPGGAGANNPIAGGAAGDGGGALAIIATQARFNGRINASGAGGRGGPAQKSGGGGGGSGGMIVIDVPTSSIMLGNGVFFANGAGGGEGGSSPGGTGGTGQDGGASTGPAMPGAGGTGRDGGDGGQGSFGASLNGANAPGNKSLGGGGGGAGGAGIIYAPGIFGNSVISPPSTGPA